MKVFKYTLDGNDVTVSPATALFNPDSRDRKDLRERGIDFNTEEEVLAWIAEKDIPPGISYTIEEI